MNDLWQFKVPQTNLANLRHYQVRKNQVWHLTNSHIDAREDRVSTGNWAKPTHKGSPTKDLAATQVLHLILRVIDRVMILLDYPARSIHISYHISLYIYNYYCCYYYYKYYYYIYISYNYISYIYMSFDFYIHA